MKTNPRIVVLLSALLFSACVTPIRPADLQIPTELTCIYLKEPLTITAPYGPFDVQWTTRLERGPYWSEKADEKGTYYRTSPGGLSVRGKEGVAFPGQPITLDGGFYVPNNVSDPITLYAYFSTAAAPVQPYPGDANCSTLRYVNDPSSSKASLISFATGGAIGGAAGGIIGRSIVGPGKMSYGQAAGTGAVAGAIGGLVVASIINSDVGKIVPANPHIKDVQFLGKLRELAATKVVIKEFQPPPNPKNDVQSTGSH